MTDREKAGLRGPVRELRTETHRPGAEAAVYEEHSFTKDGRIERREYRNPDGTTSLNEYVYASDGRLIATRWSGADTVHVTRRDYDGDGRLVRVFSRTPAGDESISETFDYAEDGAMVHSRYFPPEFWQTTEYGEGTVGFHIPATEETQLGTLAIGAALYETRFDARGLAVESAAYDETGERLARAFYRRDAEGRLVEEWIEAEFAARAALVAGFPEEVRGEASEFAGPLLNDRRVEYEYDEQGRGTVTRRQFGALGSDIVRTLHDDYGNPIAIECDDASGRHTFTRIEYHYDAAGNWIEQARYLSAERGGPEEAESVITRALSYW